MIAPSVELKIAALYDCWAFLDLIGYKGGTQNFDECHYDFVLVMQAPQLYDQGMLVGDLYERWRHLTEYKWEVPPDSALLEFARGHLKSSLVIAYMLWRTYRNPNITILHATNVRELSESFIRELRAYYEDERLLEIVWNSRPHIRGNMIPDLDRTNRRAYSDENEAKDRKVVWSNYQLQLVRDYKMKEPTIMSTSVKGKSTGSHYNLVVMDDVVDLENSETEAKNKKVKRWASDISSVVTRVPSTHHLGTLPNGVKFKETLRGEYIVTGTHYSPFDYYTFLENNAKDTKFAVFQRNIYKNGVDNTDGYLWSKFTEELELRLRAELSDTPGVFEAQYLNFVNNPAMQVLSTDLVQYVPRNQLLEGRGDGYCTVKNSDTGDIECFTPIMTIDPAVSLRARADYTAICVGGVTNKATLVAADFSVGHYSPEKTLDEVVRLIRLWGIKQVYCEVVGFQSLLRNMLLKRLALEGIRCGVLPYMPNKWGKKEKRIEMFLSPYFSDGRVIFSEDIKKSPVIINTFNFFGRGGRDDPPDSLAIIAEVSRPALEQSKAQRRRQYTTTGFNTQYGGIY
jgi:predicted phage terminase large subunit-like protein